MKAPDGWYSFRTFLKVSIKSELPSKEGRELPFWRNFEDKALSPHVLLSISAFFARRLVLQLNSCKPWWVNFDIFFHMLSESFHRFSKAWLFFLVWWTRLPNAFDFWSKCAGTRTSKTFAQCSWERYFTLTVHFVNKGVSNCYDNLARC